MISKTDASGSWSYTWDYENRLKQASKSGGVTVTYTYDALGRRVQSTSSAGPTTRFVHDGVDVVRDLDGSGSTVADYLNGVAVDNKLRQTISGTTSYFFTDHLGTTRVLTDASGGITSNLSYDSFGRIISGSAFTRYTFTGREIDAEMDLLYYRTRSYDSLQGRFVSEDTIGLRGGLNLFAYANQNPLTFRDPHGTIPVVAVVVGAIVVEFGIHYYLFNRANKLYPSLTDPHGRKKHCYVNCMSTRIHGNPVMATTFSAAQEVPTLVLGCTGGNSVENLEIRPEMWRRIISDSFSLLRFGEAVRSSVIYVQISKICNTYARDLDSGSVVLV